MSPDNVATVCSYRRALNRRLTAGTHAPRTSSGGPNARAPFVPSSPALPATPSTAADLERAYNASTAAAVRVNIGTSGLGSGFFVSPDGLVLTAAHVALADNSAALSVTTAEGQDRPARLVGYDERRDLAVLSVQGGGFPYLKLAASSPMVGDGVVAIGNSRGAFDGGRAGRVTGLNVSLDPTFPGGLAASSMPLAPGDSGGPVLNARGEVVGVSTAIGQVNGQFSSYFVPITAGSAILRDLEAGLRRGVPIIGVGVAGAQQVLGVSGVLITAVQDGLGGQRAGLQAPQTQTVQDGGRNRQQIVSADVIVAVDGRAVAAPGDLIAYLRAKNAGDRVTLKVRRGKQLLSVPVTLSDKGAA